MTSPEPATLSPTYQCLDDAGHVTTNTIVYAIESALRALMVIRLIGRGVDMRGWNHFERDIDIYIQSHHGETKKELAKKHGTSTANIHRILGRAQREGMRGAVRAGVVPNLRDHNPNEEQIILGLEWERKERRVAEVTYNENLASKQRLKDLKLKKSDICRKIRKLNNLELENFLKAIEGIL